jgi:hypothetical protein
MWFMLNKLVIRWTENFVKKSQNKNILLLRLFCHAITIGKRKRKRKRINFGRRKANEQCPRSYDLIHWIDRVYVI